MIDDAVATEDTVNRVIGAAWADSLRVALVGGPPAISLPIMTDLMNGIPRGKAASTLIEQVRQQSELVSGVTAIGHLGERLGYLP